MNWVVLLLLLFCALSAVTTKRHSLRHKMMQNSDPNDPQAKHAADENLIRHVHGKTNHWKAKHYSEVRSTGGSPIPADEHEKMIRRFYAMQKRKKNTLQNTVPPTSYDWRNTSKCVSVIKNQHSCGGCWAFSGSGTLADRACISKGNNIPLDLSPQEALTCYGVGSCTGGSAHKFWSASSIYGSVPESCYPFLSANRTLIPASSPGVCPTTCFDGTPVPKPVTNAAPYAIPINDTKSIMTEISTNGPMQLTISCCNDFHLYSSGLYHHVPVFNESCGMHDIRIVGYGTDPVAGVYYIVANSWGASWGLNGFVNILASATDILVAVVAAMPV